MVLPDANVLIYAFRRDSARHKEYRAWLQAIVDGPNAYGISSQVLASVLRICHSVTLPQNRHDSVSRVRETHQTHVVAETANET